MSATLAEVRRRVKYRLRDRDSRPAFSIPEYNREIEAQVALLAPMLVLGDGWSLAAINTVAGTDTYALPGTQEYGIVARFRLQSDGQDIPIVSFEEFERWRNGDTPTNRSRSSPQQAMLIESAAQVLSARFWPTPDAAYAIDIYTSLLPSAAFANNDASTIPFDNEAIEALELSTASVLFDKMPDEDRARCGLHDEASSTWRNMAASGIRSSRIRRRRTQGGRFIRRGRSW